MVDFNRWLCRNCKHYHDKEISEYCNYETLAIPECKCTKWESNDNLVYLEQLAAKHG